MAEKNRSASSLLAISILALAASLAYFTFTFSRFVQQIPDVLENVRLTSEKIEPVIEEVDQLRELIPPILDEVRAVREQVPPLLEEVKQVRESIPPILEEVEQVRQVIPPVLDEVKETRAQVPAVLDEVAAVRAQVPEVLQRVDAVTGEMKAYRPLVSDVLQESAALRKEIPVTLDRVDGMLDKARVSAREASSGMVTGALGGLITAPFRLVGNFGKSILGLSGEEAGNYSEEDLARLEQHGRELVVEGKVEESRSWRNGDTGQRFTVTLKRVYSENGRDCRTLYLQSWTGGEQTLAENVNVCMNDKGEWEYQ